MEIKGFIYAVLSAAFFGSAGFFIKRGYSFDLNPVELLTLQYITAIVMLFFMCIIRHPKNLRPSKKSMKRLILLGTVGNTLMTVSLYSAMAYLDVAVATMLLYTYPAMVALFSFLFYKEKISKSKAAAIAGTFVGCFFVINNTWSKTVTISYIGIGFGIMSAISYAFMNIYSKAIVDHLPPLVTTFYTTLFSIAALIVFNFDFLWKLTLLPQEALINTISLAFFCEIVPLTLLYAAIKHIGPVKASIISTLELPVSAIMAFLVMGEKLFPMQYVGIGLVLFSILLLTKK